MRADPSAARSAPAPPPTIRVRWRLAVWRQKHAREAAIVAVLLAVSAVVRLALAARGWPQINSDEAIIGLMTDDILWHHAHPIFFYGQQYMGALQAYLAAPFFAVLGPTSFALRAASTSVTLATLLLLYLFMRAVYSPAVALLTLALLALGPQNALHDELRAGVGTQDTLLFGAALLLLVYLRLRHPARRVHRLALDLGIGLSMGLGLWGDFLIVPFVVAALLALTADAIRSVRLSHAPRHVGADATQFGVLALGCLMGLWPLLVANLVSPGATLSQVLAAAGLLGAGASAAHLTLWDHVVALGQQLGATLLVGLPNTLGSGQVCVNCPAWPAPDATLALGAIPRVIALSLPFSLVAVALWTLEARPLIRDARATLHVAHTPATATAKSTALDTAVTAFDARWWGRAMLVLAAALIVLEYAASRSSYLYSGPSMRYLAGLILCAPVMVHPLWQAAQPVWRGTRARLRGMRLSTRPGYAAMLAVVLLCALVAINLAGVFSAFHDTRDGALYGVPASGRDAQVLAFLQAHDATRFYAGYWTCYRLVFAAREQVRCAVVSESDAFTLGNNRIPLYSSAVAVAPHPAYVFDTAVRKDDPRLPAQVAARISQHDPRFAGYTAARLAGFIVYYYAGSV